MTSDLLSANMLSSRISKIWLFTIKNSSYGSRKINVQPSVNIISHVRARSYQSSCVPRINVRLYCFFPLVHVIDMWNEKLLICLLDKPKIVDSYLFLSLTKK